MNSKKIRIIILTLAAVLALLAGAGRTLAVDADLFELDGNALAVTGDDWDTVLLGGGGSSIVHLFVVDPCTQTIFTGGKKDIQDITEWGWKNTGGFPDKDDITNAYGTAYLSNGDLIAYFGCDRFANNGDAFLGFWFFQNRVGLNPNGTFSGSHAVGDILVLIDFPQATNAKPTISVVKWNPNPPPGKAAAKNLELLSTGTQSSGSASVCASDGSACAITNLNPEISPWDYTPKSGTPGIFPYESFFEGGINLTQLLGTTQCFSSFMAESRSSEQFTATLKDFVLGDFPVCSIAIEKACNVVRLANENDLTDKYFVVDFNGVVINTGAGALPVDAILTIVDDAGTPGDTSDDVTIEQPLASPLPKNQSLLFSGRFFSNSNPPLNTVRASIEFSGTTITADPFSIECTKLDLNPKLSLSKRCWTELVTIESLLVVKVFFTGEVCNTGDVPLNVTVTDDKAGVVLAQTLMAPGVCKTINGSYLPEQANGGETNPCNAEFSDTFTAVGTSSIPGVGTQTEIFTANCPPCCE